MTPAPAGTQPFVHRRRVLWGDTDAARIAYTARFLDFAMEAIDEWFLERIGADWFRMVVDHGVGTPFVHVALDFRSPVTPRDLLDSTVRLVQLGRSSLRFAVSGATPEGRAVYDATLVCAFVQPDPMQSIPVPDRFRPALEAELAVGLPPPPAGAG